VASSPPWTLPPLLLPPLPDAPPLLLMPLPLPPPLPLLSYVPGAASTLPWPLELYVHPELALAVSMLTVPRNMKTTTVGVRMKTLPDRSF
jgi:hypothetical protein